MQEKATREISGIRKEKDDAGHRLVAECDRLSDSLRKAKDKKSQCKKAGIQIPGKLRRVLKQVEGLQAELGQAQYILTARSAECDRLRRTVSNRDVASDQMRVQLSDLASQSDRTIQDNMTLRDRIALLVNGDASTAHSTLGSYTRIPVSAKH